MATTETATERALRRHGTCCQPQHAGQVTMCGGPVKGRDVASEGEPVTCSDCLRLAATGWCPVLGTCPARRPKPEPEPERREPKGPLAGRTRTNLGSDRVRRPRSS